MYIYIHIIHILYFSKILYKHMHIAYSYGYYTMTDAKLYHGLMYPATLLGGYPDPFSNDEASGTSGGLKKNETFRMFWDSVVSIRQLDILGSWKFSMKMQIACAVKLRQTKEFDNVPT